MTINKKKFDAICSFIFSKEHLVFNRTLQTAGLAALLSIALPTAQAATAIDLEPKKDASILLHLNSGTAVASPGSKLNRSGSVLKESLISLDTIHRIAHIHAKQYYTTWVDGKKIQIPVLNGDFIVHQKYTNDGDHPSLTNALHLLKTAVTKKTDISTTVNATGTVYEQLDGDAKGTDMAKLLDNATEVAQIAEEKTKEIYSAYGNNLIIKPISNTLIMAPNLTEGETKFVFHAQLHVSAKKDNKKIILGVVNFLLDAKQPGKIYRQWDSLQTATSTFVHVKGAGGNTSTGELHYSNLMAERYASSSSYSSSYSCDLGYRSTYSNQTVYVYVYDNESTYPLSFLCNSNNSGYYDDGYLEGNRSQGYYSPANDVLHGVLLVLEMYKNGYQENPGGLLYQMTGSNHILPLNIHSSIAGSSLNAAWDPSTQQMYFGDGGCADHCYYPFTSLSVLAHEFTHGVTSIYSNLGGYGARQAGAMNEAFSDMAAIAASFYEYSLTHSSSSQKQAWVTNKNHWAIGSDISKDGSSLRTLYNPSLKSYEDYHKLTEVHEGAGIYDYFFYTLSQKWKDVTKAFNLVLYANKNYWQSNSTFTEGACGIVQSAVDLGYSSSAKKDIKSAFNTVGIDTQDCE